MLITLESWNQAVLKQWEYSLLLNKTTGAFDGARTHDWQAASDYESDALPTAQRHPQLYLRLKVKRFS